MENIILFDNKRDCCACGACANICPRNAIELVEDEFGFKYPNIDKEKCIKCGMCKKVCAYQKNDNFNTNIESYAAISNDNKILNNSASGGIFGQIAKNFIKEDGVVYGCSMEKENNKLTPKHIRVENIDELIKLQGSKYVQSDINYIYKDVKKDLMENNSVLFSGTPCQIDALKRYLSLQKINDENLYTVDIICHGVPSKKMFQDYISNLEKQKNINITSFKFRDKTKGWGLKAKINYKVVNSNKEKVKYVDSHFSSFYQLFLDSKIYRENCYSCKYAQQKRVGDITLGDYWGIESEHPELLNKIDINKGISCVLVNSEKGKTLLKEYSKDIDLNTSNLEKISKQNHQLNTPSICSRERNNILNIFKTKDYCGVEKYYFDKIKNKKIIYFIWRILPSQIKKKLKRG